MFGTKDGCKPLLGRLIKYNCIPGVTEITVPDNVKSIEKEAFRDCGILRQIIIPDTVKTIAPAAFYHCEQLEEIRLPEGLQEIPDKAFCNCSSLRTIHIPASVKRIGESAFEHCSSLAQLELPHGLKTIENNAFAGCRSLQEMRLPDSVQLLGWGACSSCHSLANVELSKHLTVIREDTFRDCRILEEVYLPDSVCMLERAAFFGCKALRRVRLSPHLKTLPDYSLWDCGSLQLELYDTLQEVETQALPSHGRIAELTLHSGRFQFQLYHIDPQFCLPVLRLIAEKNIAKKERRFSQLIQQGLPGNLEFTLRLYLAIACESPIQMDVIQRNPRNIIGWLIDNNAPTEIAALLEHKILTLRQAEEMLEYAITRKQKRTKIQMLLTRYCHEMGGTPHDPVEDLKL